MPSTYAPQPKGQKYKTNCRPRFKISRNRLNEPVIFSSDNGYMEGEHGLIDKRNAYEESMRIPLVMSAPGLIPPGTVVKNSVTTLDFAPTLLDCAGVASPPQFEGRSLLPLATGALSPDQWNEDVVYEYYLEWNFPQTPTTFAIRTPQFKYIQYHGVWTPRRSTTFSPTPAKCGTSSTTTAT